MIDEFKDSESETIKVKADFFTLGALLETLKDEQSEPFLKEHGYPEAPELIEAALWVTNEISRKCADISNGMFDLRDQAHNLQFEPEKNETEKAA